MKARLMRNILRRPLYSAAIVLFTVVMTVVLCCLHKAGQEELRSYEKTYASIPVTFRVTDLDGSKPDKVEGWIADQFTEQGMRPTLAPFVGQLYARVSVNGQRVIGYEYIGGEKVPQYEPIRLAGIGALYVAEELTEDWGGAVYWNEGYDESILTSEEPVCLLPESMKDLQQVDLYFKYSHSIDGVSYSSSTTCQLQVVGYYVDKGNTRIYCPYLVAREICAALGASKDIEELCAVLNDNNSLPQLRQVGAEWFAEPNPSGEKTVWGKYSFQYYLYALDIDDYMLANLETNMKNSMRLNSLASVAVFVLSAGAGFLTGFLVIRARKREIALMRTMGASHPMIFTELAMEQMLCVLAGILAGGLIFLWRPVLKLLLFAGIYLIGLSIALVIFLFKNLLTTIKEDE